MPRRRNNLSLLNKALFFAVIAHAGLFFWSTTAIVPGGGGSLGTRVLDTLGLSDVSLSLHPQPRNTTSDIASSIRQQSAHDAPVPGSFAAQTVAPMAGQAKIDAPPLRIDLPQSSFGSSPLTVHVAAPVVATPVAPKLTLPTPAELMASAQLSQISAIVPDVGSPVLEAERPAPPIAPASAAPMQTVLPATPPMMVAPAPPVAAAAKEMPSLAPVPPLDVTVSPINITQPAVPLPPPAAAAALNLPDLPLVAAPDRVVEVAPESVPVVSRLIPETSRQQTASSAFAPAPPSFTLPTPAPASAKPEGLSLAAPPPAVSSPAVVANAPPSMSSPTAVAVAPSSLLLPPPPIAITPTVEKIATGSPAVAERTTTASPLPTAMKIDAAAMTGLSHAMSGGEERLTRKPSLAAPPPASPAAIAARGATGISAPVPASIAAPSISAAPPTLGGLPDLAVAPPKIGGPQVLSQRAPEQRRPLIEKLGGTPASETAVDRALAWLAKNQERDGRWTHIDDRGRHAALASVQTHDMALTGLSVLAFLAADHSPAKDGPYRENVARAVKWLIEQQGTDGDLRGAKTLRGPGSALANFYDQAIATMALAEAALMTGDKRMTSAAIAGGRFICASQNLRTGGWRYVPAESGDTSVFGWQIMALHDCEQLGFDLPPQVRDRAIHYLTMVSSGPSRSLAGYLPGEGPTPVMSAEALLCRVLLGEPLEPAAVREVTEFLTRDLPQSNKLDLYYWYYASLSLAQMQANPQVRLAWDRWNTRCRDTLIATQSREEGLAGSWRDGHWGEYGGRVFSTALATLTLEVYYRYLPMQPSDPQDAAKAWRAANPPRAPVAPPARPKFDAN